MRSMRSTLLVIRAGFTGTQQLITLNQARQIWTWLKQLDPEEFHHGDCIGADEAAHYIAKSLGIECIGHPPIISKKRAFTDCDQWRPAKPYLDRNHDIVNEVEEMAACPKTRTEELRSGTWATIRYARKQKVPLTMMYP